MRTAATWLIAVLVWVLAFVAGKAVLTLVFGTLLKTVLIALLGLGAVGVAAAVFRKR